jgi:hypothetical protein
MADCTRPAGLSLGGIPALTADRSWLAVAGALGAQIELLR